MEGQTHSFLGVILAVSDFVHIYWLYTSYFKLLFSEYKRWDHSIVVVCSSLHEKRRPIQSAAGYEHHRHQHIRQQLNDMMRTLKCSLGLPGQINFNDVINFGFEVFILGTQSTRHCLYALA